MRCSSSVSKVALRHGPIIAGCISRTRCSLRRPHAWRVKHRTIPATGCSMPATIWIRRESYSHLAPAHDQTDNPAKNAAGAGRISEEGIGRRRIAPNRTR
jgi:hypothetical protein